MTLISTSKIIIMNVLFHNIDDTTTFSRKTLVSIPGNLTFHTDLIVHSCESGRNTSRLMTLILSCITMQEHTKHISFVEKLLQTLTICSPASFLLFNRKVASCVTS